MARVDLDRLGKRFGGAVALADVSLTIEHGALACLLGPSGCGKTTTLRLLAGFMPPDSGTIRVGDRVVSSPGRVVPPEQRNMSMIFQNYALWPHMTIAENVSYGLETRRMPRVERDARVNKILDVIRLKHIADRYPHQLSGGQQQRVALARALVVEPATLLLDEPLSNLDANLRDEMRSEIRRLHLQFRFTTAYVTHDHIEAMTTADLIVVMNHGHIEQAGAPDEIYERPRSAFVARFVGGANVLNGRANGTEIDCGGIRLDCAHREPAADGTAAVAIRPHRIEISPRGRSEPRANEASGIVERQNYLGQHRDYLVALADGQRLRVTAPPESDLPAGAEVLVRLPREWCRALPK
jgi:iron(III) transport system ATP-binding protein